jgi:ribosomal protein S18 acetylase RimI-like enzyme
MVSMQEWTCAVRGTLTRNGSLRSARCYSFRVQSPPLTFRRARRVDVARVVALVEAAYRGEASRAGWTTEADLLAGQRTDAEEVAGLIAGTETRLVLASYPPALERTPMRDASESELVGSMLLARQHSAGNARDHAHAATGSASYVYVGMVAVWPAAQQRGIGRALLAEAERIARDERLGSTLRMTVIGQRRELIAWYERRGYRRTGEREPFPYGQPRFGLPRRDDLYFEVLEKAVPRGPV